MMPKKQKDAHAVMPISFRLPPDLLARLDAHCEGHTPKFARTAVVIAAIEAYLADAEKKRKPK